MIPAMRATLSTSPFFKPLLLISGSGRLLEKKTVPTAMAVRWEAGLLVMLTMWAVPVGVR